jgi:dihydrofolate reductase
VEKFPQTSSTSGSSPVATLFLWGERPLESIGRALPNRTNIVVTSSPTFTAERCTVCHTIPEAIEKARELGERELFVIGGGQIYAETIGMADRLYITQVHRGYEGDVKFPDYSQLHQGVVT